MKKKYFLLLAVAFMLLFSSNKVNAQEINSEFNKIINDLIENYNQQNYQAIRKDFSDHLGTVFNETTTTQMFSGLYTDLGKIVNRKSSEIKSPYEIDVLVVFEINAEELVISFTFSDKNEILGLSLYSPEATKINYPEITKSTTIEEIAAPYVEKNKNSSLIIGIYDNGEEKFLKFGKNKNSDAFNINSIYEIGSVTKTFTATILAIMVENGEMNYDDPISNYLPDSIPKLIKPNGKEITLEDLATHTSGLPRLPENLEKTIKNPLNPYANYSLENLYDYLQTVKVGTSNYEYSNLGMGLLGEILATHSKMTYKELVKKYITEELGMNNTEIKLSEVQQKKTF
ncbi:serine hydrolase [Mesonia maritima]|uniref:serine hydrolase n=1 Tax=Mesonia maritima TaxID=1793873 RepID=UPI00363BB14A